MTRRALLVVAVLATVLLAGCFGGPASGPQTDEPTEEQPRDANSPAVPGVDNGSLANASALAQANEAAFSANGGNLTVDWDTATTDATFELTASPAFETYVLAGAPYGASPNGSVSIWANESERVVRTTGDGNASYRVVGREDDLPNVLEGVEDYLATGEFTVANDQGTNGTVVLTAADYAPLADGHGPIEDPSEYSARLVVGEDGRIHNLTVDAVEASGETHRYSYVLGEASVGTVSQPDWLDDVPASAGLHAMLAVDVANSSYLSITHDGGDAIPAGATIEATVNETDYAATFETVLEAGTTRYAYLDAESGDLVVSADRPSADAIDPLTSPVSVSIVTADGVTLHSSGMAWESSSASAPDAGGDASSGSSSASSSSSSEAGSEA